MAISLAVSALLHGALLAWVTLSIPESRTAAGGLDHPGPEIEPVSRRFIEVVRIQPPGVLPAGGSAGSSAGASGQAGRAAALPAELPSVSVRGVGTSTAGRLAFVAIPESPLALPALGEPAAEAPASNRGILRRRPESGAFPGQGDRWTSSTPGRRFGGGGVTISGVGTDCITAGSGGLDIRPGFSLPGKGRGWDPGGPGTGGRRMGWSGR
ncbi:hypothetical protein [Candidatus Palauibacter sp.]|uniref:hypothetical protein n=1 Tax=Candidatus Palauibacter sp. TaxID=3101350 RepID=UPI003B029B41